MMNKNQVIAKAIEAGADIEEIEAEAAKLVRQVGSVPFKNMIVALQLMPWFNSKDDWVRLAGAMMAKGLKRKIAA